MWSLTKDMCPIPIRSISSLEYKAFRRTFNASPIDRGKVVCK